MYFIELSQWAQGFLDKLDSQIKDRIEKTLKRLENNPVPSDTKFIGREKDEKIFRYRIGDYRVLYLLNESTKIILVTKIDKRPRVYKDYNFWMILYFYWCFVFVVVLLVAGVNELF